MAPVRSWFAATRRPTLHSLGLASYETMMRRYGILLALGLLILGADQITKILVVRHFTPGIGQAQLEAQRASGRITSLEHQDQVLDPIGSFSQLSLYFSTVKNPCAPNLKLCPRVQVIENIWNWQYAENKGAAWSVFADLDAKWRRPMLAGISTLGVLLIFFFAKDMQEDQQRIIKGLGLILGGALGNLVDRVHLGYVVDFIQVYLGSYAWPIFNVADIAISCGIGLILLDMLVASRSNLGERSIAQS